MATAKILIKILGHNKFFTSILILATLHAVWYAFSFKPIIFDEGHHFRFSLLYSENISPFITIQDSKWDFLGEITRNSSYLYYYLLSWPLRVISVFTNSLMVQVIVLRVIHIGLFAYGLTLYRKLFDKLKISRTVSHISLAILILAPALSPLPGAINYDNVSFVLFPALWLMLISILKDKKPSFMKMVAFLSLLLLGSLLKFSNLAFTIPIGGYFLYKVFKKYGLEYWAKIKRNYSSSRLNYKILGILILALSVGLFIERPVYNVVKYGNIHVPCVEILNEERCKENYTQRRNLTNIEALNENPDTFEPLSLYGYFTGEWAPGMVSTLVRLGGTAGPTLPMLALYSAIFFGGGVLLLIYLRDFIKQSDYMAPLLTTSAIYTLILIFHNYQGYLKQGEVVAVTGRYLLPILPIFFVGIVWSVKRLLGQHHRLAIAAIIVTAFTFTQGGGIMTYAINANPDYQWDSGIVQTSNIVIEGVSRTVIVDRLEPGN